MHEWSAARHQWLSLVLRAGLSTRSLSLAALLCNDYASRETGECWPGLAELARALGWSESTVRRAMNDLEEGGFLSIRRGCGRGHLTVITLGLAGDAAAQEEGGRREEVARRVVSLAMARAASRPKKGGRDPAETRGERVADLHLKGSRPAHAYKEEPRRNPSAPDAEHAPSRRHATSGGYVLGSDEDWKVRRWEDALSRSGLPPLDLIAKHTTTADGRKHWLVSAEFPPIGPAETEAARAFFARHGLADLRRGAA